GFDSRSANFPGAIGPFRLIPRLFFRAKSPPPQSAPNVATSAFYTGLVFGPPNKNCFPTFLFRGTHVGFGSPDVLDGDFVFYRFAASMPAISPADRPGFYASFARDSCHKYLTVFAYCKYTPYFF